MLNYDSIIYELISKESHKLPSMTKSKHWLWVALSYPICALLAFLSFMTVPSLGLLFLPLPTALTFIGIILYLKNTQQKSKGT